MLYLFSMLQRKGNGSTSSARRMTPALRGQRKVLGKGALQHLCVRLTSELGRGCSLRTAALTLQFTLGVFTYPKMNVTKYVQVPCDSLSFTPMWETLWRAEIPKDPFRPPSPFPKKRVQLLTCISQPCVYTSQTIPTLSGTAFQRELTSGIVCHHPQLCWSHTTCLSASWM